MGHANALNRLPLLEFGPDPAPTHKILHLESLPEHPIQVRDIAGAMSKDCVLSHVLDWVGSGVARETRI